MSNTTRCAPKSYGDKSTRRSRGKTKLASCAPKTGFFSCDDDDFRHVRERKLHRRARKMSSAKNRLCDWDVYISAIKDRWNYGRKHTKYGRKYGMDVMKFKDNPEFWANPKNSEYIVPAIEAISRMFITLSSYGLYEEIK